MKKAEWRDTCAYYENKILDIVLKRGDAMLLDAELRKFIENEVLKQVWPAEFKRWNWA